MRRGLWRALPCAGLVLAVGRASGGQEAAPAPQEAVAAARAASSDTARGASMRVVLLTVGPGDEVWERFGHNLLWIRDERTGASVAWNWGLFSFAEPGFYRRFLFGDTRYWMEGDDLEAVIAMYRRANRAIVAQELALSPGQRAAIDAFARINARDDLKYYRYDYFLDNCSTRVRDAIDIALNGVLKATLGTRLVEPRVTYRTETLRLVQAGRVLAVGMDLALGARADRALTEWEAAYIPMRLRDALRAVTVPGPEGAPVPLVSREYVVLPAARDPEPSDVAVGKLAGVVIVPTLVLLAAAMAFGVLAKRGVGWARTGSIATGVVVHLVFGLLSAALVFVWLFTRHEFWGWNGHLLLMTPLSLLVAARLPFGVGGKWGRWIGPYHLTMVAVALGVALLLFARFRADPPPGAALLTIWSHAAWMLYLVLYETLIRRRSSGEGPTPPDAAAMRLAA